MLMSLLGHYNNFFFAAHLVDIAMGVKTLRTILSSVTHNGKQVTLLLKIRNQAFSWPVLFFCFFTLDPLFSFLSLQLVMTVGLLAVVVYLYTVVAFNFFRKFYNMSEDEDEPDMKCDDMMTVSGGQPPHKKQQSKKSPLQDTPSMIFWRSALLWVVMLSKLTSDFTPSCSVTCSTCTLVCELAVA